MICEKEKSTTIIKLNNQQQVAKTARQTSDNIIDTRNYNNNDNNSNGNSKNFNNDNNDNSI